MEACEAFPSVDTALLKRGWHVSHIDVSDEFGGPSAMAAFDAFYPFACKKLDLTEKPMTGGFSRGELPASLWTIRNSDEVSGVYLDVAVMNILSGPGKNSRKRGSAVSKRWGSDKLSAQSWNGPLDKMQALVEAGVPVMITAGGADDAVP